MKTESTSTYRQNRARYPLEDLRRHEGQWVAFTLDGARILAAAPTIAEVSAALSAAGGKLEDVVLERIEVESDEVRLGAAELP